MPPTTERLLEAHMEANRLMQTGRPEMPISVMNTFLAIILRESEGQAERPCLLDLSVELGLPATSMSRHVRYLGEFERRGVPGCGWVSVSIHPKDGRQRVVQLTRKGKAVADRLRRTLNVS